MLQRILDRVSLPFRRGTGALDGDPAAAGPDTAAGGMPIGRDDLYLTLLPHGLEKQRKLGFRPRKDSKPWPLDLPLDWAADPFGDRNWCFQLNAWRMTDPLLSAYFRTGEPALLSEVLRFVEDWHRFHLVERRPNTFAWYDMASGIRALRLAFLLEAARDGRFDPGEEGRRILLALVDEHVRRLCQERFISINNHGLLQVAGLHLLCSTMPERDGCAKGLAFARAKFREIMAAQFTAQGIHTENSPAYHLFVRNLLVSIGALKRLPGTSEMALIEAAKPWLTFPDGAVARTGDSTGRHHPLAEDPEKPAALADGRSFAVADFTASGYAIVRSLPSQAQQSMLFVTGMAHTLTHKHADDLSFELFEFGRFVFVDTGKYGYNRDEMRSYVRSAAAHNTIGILDRRIYPSEVALTGSLLKPIRTTRAGFVIEGKVERPKLFTQHRTMTYDPGRSLTIRDKVKSSGADRAFVSSLHLAPDLEPVMDATGFTVALNDRALRAELVEQDCELSTARGREDPMLGWHSVGYLRMVPASVVQAVGRGRSRSFTWKITFG